MNYKITFLDGEVKEYQLPDRCVGVMLTNKLNMCEVECDDDMEIFSTQWHNIKFFNIPRNMRLLECDNIRIDNKSIRDILEITFFC